MDENKQGKTETTQLGSHTQLRITQVPQGWVPGPSSWLLSNMVTTSAHWALPPLSFSLPVSLSLTASLSLGCHLFIKEDLHWVSISFTLEAFYAHSLSFTGYCSLDNTPTNRPDRSSVYLQAKDYLKPSESQWPQQPLSSGSSRPWWIPHPEKSLSQSKPLITTWYPHLPKSAMSSLPTSYPLSCSSAPAD